MSEFQLFLEQAATFVDRNGSLPLKTHTKELQNFPAERLIAVQDLIDNVQKYFRETISPRHRRLLLELKDNGPSSLSHGAPCLSTFFWKKRNERDLTLHDLIHQRISLCAIYRFLREENFHTDKQWRGSSFKRLVDFITSSIEEARDMPYKDVENIIKHHIRYAKNYDEWAKELGGDIYLFLMPENKERDQLWRRFRDRASQPRSQKNIDKESLYDKQSDQKKNQDAKRMEELQLLDEAKGIASELELNGKLEHLIDEALIQVRLLIPIKSAPRLKRKREPTPPNRRLKCKGASSVIEKHDILLPGNEVPPSLPLQTDPSYINPTYIDEPFLDPPLLDPPYLDPTLLSTDTLWMASIFSPDTLEDSSYLPPDQRL